MITFLSGFISISLICLFAEYSHSNLSSRLSAKLLNYTQRYYNHTYNLWNFNRVAENLFSVFKSLFGDELHPKLPAVLVLVAVSGHGELLVVHLIAGLDFVVKRKCDSLFYCRQL